MITILLEKIKSLLLELKTNIQNISTSEDITDSIHLENSTTYTMNSLKVVKDDNFIHVFAYFNMSGAALYFQPLLSGLPSPDYPVSFSAYDASNHGVCHMNISNEGIIQPYYDTLQISHYYLIDFFYSYTNTEE